MIFVFPKLQQICMQTGVKIPGVYQITSVLSDKSLFIGIGCAVALFLLERRFRNWPRYRRATIGIGVFLLNTAVLALITFMVILALLAAPAMAGK